MDGDAKIRACLPPDYNHSGKTGVAKILACAPPSRPGADTLTRLHRCLAESRPQDDDDLSKAFPSAATPDLDAALAAVRRYGAGRRACDAPNAA